MSQESYAAFLLASAHCSPLPALKARPRSSDVSLPSPTPPPTRLDRYRGPLPKRPDQEGQAAILKKSRADPAAANRSAITSPMQTEKEADMKEAAARRQISRPWREIPPRPTNGLKQAVNGALIALQRDKISDLVKHRTQMTRQVWHRIEAFDKRVAALCSGGKKVAVSESAENNSAGDASGWVVPDFQNLTAPSQDQLSFLSES